MARLVGAKPIETVVMNSLTVNLHLLMVSFYRPAGARRKIMIERRVPLDSIRGGNRRSGSTASIRARN